jgi:hypothetical protein
VQQTAYPKRCDAHPALAAPQHDGKVIRLILNVLWLIFGSGIALAVGYGIAALICFVLIITIPFGVAALLDTRWYPQAPPRTKGHRSWPRGPHQSMIVRA